MKMKSIVFFVLVEIIFLTKNSSEKSSIINQLDSLIDEKFRCTLLLGSGVIGNINGGESINSFFVTISKWLERYNCTLKTIKYIEQGDHDENGTYNGFIGYVQRNEVDWAAIGIRPDGLPFEPGKPTPPIYAADVAIISRRNGSSSVARRKVTSFLNLDLAIYAYTFITFFFIFPMIIVLDKFLFDHKIESKKIINCYFDSCYRSFSLLIDYEQFNPYSLTSHVIVLFFSIFTLIAVFGFLLNTVGADLVYKKEPSVIDSFDDLINSQLQPAVLKKLAEYQLIKYSLPGSELNKLWIKMNENLDKSILDIDLENTQNALSILTKCFKQINQSEIAILINENNAKNIKTAACFMKNYPDINDIANRIHISKDLFATGIYTGLLSNNIHPLTEKLIIYLSRTMVETSLLSAVANVVKPNIPDLSPIKGIKYDSEVIRCIEPPKEHGVEKYQPFGLLDLLGLFQGWFILSFSWSSFLLIEILLKKNSHFKTRKRAKVNKTIKITKAKK